MPKLNTVESRRRVLPDFKLIPAVAHLPPKVLVERRNLVVRNALPLRIRSEFREMPGLSLTLAQAGKLFGLPLEACSRILLQLADERILTLRSDGRYVRRSES